MAIYEFEGFIPVIHESAFVHPQANVTGNVFIGKNCYIGPGAVLRGDWGKIVLKDGCNVQENCVVHMFPGTTVTLKEGAHIGIPEATGQVGQRGNPRKSDGGDAMSCCTRVMISRQLHQQADQRNRAEREEDAQ